METEVGAESLKLVVLKLECASGFPRELVGAQFAGLTPSSESQGEGPGICISNGVQVLLLPMLVLSPTLGTA